MSSIQSLRCEMNNEIHSHPSLDDLVQRRAEGLTASERAIQKRYLIYMDLKRLVEKVNTDLLDVADYYSTAVLLGTLLCDISRGYSNTVFHYFAEHIDPRKKGDVRCFRMECRQLNEQFEELERRRIDRRRIKIIK
jgi:hypothetical protein